MKSSNKKTYFLFASEEGGVILIQTLEDLLIEKENSYVNILYITNSSNKELTNKIDNIRNMFYDRLIVKKISYKPQITINSLFTSKGNLLKINTLKHSVKQFVIDYKQYASNEEYFIIACSKTSSFIKSALKSMDLECSKSILIPS